MRASCRAEERRRRRGRGRGEQGGRGGGGGGGRQVKSSQRVEQASVSLLTRSEDRKMVEMLV
eukprot:31488-Hanusia_phi.AAC.2